jgi:hypothetical protein
VLLGSPTVEFWAAVPREIEFPVRTAVRSSIDFLTSPALERTPTPDPFLAKDRTPSVVPEELSGARERPMIMSMPTTARPQQRDDHRLRNLVQRTGDVAVATDLGVPRSTARGWLGAAPTVVVCLDVVDLTDPELRQEVLKLRRRAQKLTVLLRLALALRRTSGFNLTGDRLPDRRAKLRILRAVDRAREYLPLRAVLRLLRVSPSRSHAWRRHRLMYDAANRQGAEERNFDPPIEKAKGDDMNVPTPQASNSGRFWNPIPALLIALVIPYVALVSAAPQRPSPPTGRAADFSGLWIEIPRPPGAAPSGGPPLRMRLTQQGARLEVRLRGNANPTPNDPVFGVATIAGQMATWTGPESCGSVNQKPGYNYDHPGSSQYTLALEHPIDGPAPPRPQMLYTTTTTWNVPCDGIQAGTSQTTMVLERGGS